MFCIFYMPPISNVIISSVTVLTAYNPFVTLLFSLFYSFIYLFFFRFALILQPIACYNFGFL
jgi:hypothetical protein